MNEIIEKHVTITGKVTLKGTIALPEGLASYPALLLLHGSGPVDRDENTSRLNINAFKDLSNAICPLGCAVLRYDKRGVGKSEGKFMEAGFWDLVDDAESALEFLKNYPGINSSRIILLGHSEGCAIAAALNARQPVQGLILLSGAAESLKATIARQGDLLFRELWEMKGFKGLMVRLFRVIEKGKRDRQKTIRIVEESKGNTVKIKNQQLNARWMREHFAYNVVDDLEKITCPTLVITGEKDIQVLPEHAQKIAGLVRGPSEYHVIRDMNHLLRKQAGPVSMLNLKKEYGEAVKNSVDEELVGKIQGWLVRTYSL